MANETQEIGEIVKKCKILLLDIEGTTTSISFVKDKLFPYAEDNVQKFLETQWETDDVKEAVSALRKQALEDQERKVDGVVTIPGGDAPKDEQIGGLVNSVKWLMSSDRKVGSLKQLQGLVWKQGYDSGDIKGHVYEDVAAALEHWRSTEGQKVYIYSSGSVQAQKLLFGQSLAGDLLARIDGHFDTAVGAKQEAASYTAIAEKVEAKPEEILFLTDIVKEAEAARTAGMATALVSREGNAPLPEPAGFPVLRSLAQLAATNKRKQDPQVEEETPAKVPKTDAEKDVKATVEAVSAAASEEVKEEKKMDVEADSKTPTENPPEPEKKAVKVVAIEEITDSNEAVDVPMIDVEPVVEEELKTEKKETEKEDVQTSNGVSELKPNEKTNGSETEAVTEKPAEGMVIEEITNDMCPFTGVANDAKPVIEEPPSEPEMEVLENVAQVLDKECDEILSKVQDVTNLDSIPVKPMLNSIAEETMETENTDSNDIVDRILDTEQELEKEKMNTVASGDENKTSVENGLKEIVEIKEANGNDDKTPENNVESNNTVEKNSSEEVSTEVKTSLIENKTEKDAPVLESKEKPVESDKLCETPETTKSADGEIKPVEESKLVPESLGEEVKKPVEEKPVEEKPVEEKTVEEKPIEEKFVEEKTVEEKPVNETTPGTETKIVEESKAIEKSKPDENSSEPQMNGQVTNGDSAPNMNGDTVKEEEKVCSRLTVENGKVPVNGSNGDSMDTEQGQGDNKIEEIADIKVKTIAAVEPPAAPTDQSTEA